MKDRKKTKQKPHRRPPPAAFSDAERALWDILRDRQVAGARFMRHVPIGRLTVDFVCREHRLAVLLDSVHPGRYDGRDQSLAARGYRVLRFDEDTVFRHPERIRSAVAAWLHNSGFSEGRNE
jgi:very-short-patch-repair endonuclease